MLSSEDLVGIKQRFGIVGNAPLLNHAISVAIQVASTDMTVLISGESGVGKESFSKIIHQLSARKHGPFIAINCGAIPEGTIDSELFGHEKGAFTGAVDARKGYFEVTNGGTIFLDEIGEMPLGTQARLLRVLENGEFIKVGSSKVQKTDVRVVAATNVNLQDAIAKKEFREDLFYRLSTVPIYVPALRERGEDILLLVRKFAADFSEKYRTKTLKLSESSKPFLLQQRFPGNIRQLKNLVEQLSVLESDKEISPEIISNYLPNPASPGLPAVVKASDPGMTFSERDLLYKILFDVKKDMAEIKSIILQQIKEGSIPSDVLTTHKELFSKDTDLNLSTNLPALPSAPNTSPPMYEDSPIILTERHLEYEDDDKTEDISHETEELSLSIHTNEKDLIVKALKKNNNRRKNAAKDLGISERTLYRKIKQYDLEELN